MATSRVQARFMHRDQIRKAAREITAMGEPGKRWWRQAACQEIDVNGFFGIVSPQVRAMCKDCPVRVDCMTDAVGFTGTDDGFRAGTSPLDRDAIREALR